jgi:uncharacterized membrane protein YgcG
MFHKVLICLMFAAALAGAGVATAQLAPLGDAPVATSATARAAEPNAQQIYAAAAAGNLGEARQMVEQVLHKYPQSARAHYVAAEVYARSGSLTRARQELHTAEQLSPGLSFVRPAAVAALERELGAGRMLPAQHGFSWGAIVLVLGIGALILALLRRRRMVAAPFGQPYAPYGANPYGPGNAPYPGGYGPGYGAPMGGGLMGNLATGLAVGAGVAAGEGLVEHALGHHAGGGIIPNADAAGMPDPGVNSDMGGSDFGITDGGSWDGGGGDPFGGGDLGGGDMGGGGDWT